MLEFLSNLLFILPIIIVIEIIVVIVFILKKYFKTMKKPPFWVYICGGFVLLSLHDIISFWYCGPSETGIPLYIIRMMAYFIVLIGIIELCMTFKRVNH